jgi:DDE family transposase
VNDAEPLAHDPTFRLIGSEEIWDRGAALTSRVHSFETELLTQDKNLAGLAAINRGLISRVEAKDAPSGWCSTSTAPRSWSTGNRNRAPTRPLRSTCYHPLLLFNREDDCLAVKLRPGNVHSAEQWEKVLLPEIERQQQQGKDVVVRADAAFAKPEVYEALEARGVKYAIRIPSNDILEREVAELLTRSVGRPSHKPVVRYKSFRYQAATWTTARRVVAKEEWHCGEQFPRVGFIVTTLDVDELSPVPGE